MIKVFIQRWTFICPKREWESLCHNNPGTFSTKPMFLTVIIMWGLARSQCPLWIIRIRNHQCRTKNFGKWRVPLLSAPIRMMTSSNGNIFRGTGPLCWEFTGHRWILLTKASDAEHLCFLWAALEQRLNKQSWHRWFQMTSLSLWRHCNELER